MSFCSSLEGTEVPRNPQRNFMQKSMTVSMLCACESRREREREGWVRSCECWAYGAESFEASGAFMGDC